MTTATTATKKGPLMFDDLKKEEVIAYEVTFTPEQARAIVRATTSSDANFRKLMDDQRLQQAVDAMQRGQWDWTDADPIRLHVLAETGELVASDGQHRLMAAAKARRNLRSLVLFGDPWVSGLHVDRNRVRNVAQFLQHEYAIKSAVNLVALTRFELARIAAYHNKTTPSYQRAMVDDEAVIAYIIQHQSELHWAQYRGQVGGARGFHVTAYSTFLLELLTFTTEGASQFHADMMDANLEALDPLSQLRKTIARRHGETGLKLHRDATMANLVKCWNERAQGRTLTQWKMAGDDVFFPAGYKVPPAPESRRESA